MYDVAEIRRQFPALNEKYNGRPAIFFDNPGGTQVHGSVIAAMVDYMTRRNSNTHGLFETSRRTDAVIKAAHQAIADLLGCDADEVVFGNNMTSLTFHVSRSLAQELKPGDEVVVTRLDHEANVMPWALVAQERGARVRWADVDVETGTLDMEDLRRKITPRTKIVAVGFASNATGTINDVATVVGWAGEVGRVHFRGCRSVRRPPADRRKGSGVRLPGLLRLQIFRSAQRPDLWQEGTLEAAASLSSATGRGSTAEQVGDRHPESRRDGRGHSGHRLPGRTRRRLRDSPPPGQQTTETDRGLVGDPGV